MTPVQHSAFSFQEFIDAQSREWPSYAANLDTLRVASDSGNAFSIAGCRWMIDTLTLSYRKASVKADLAAIARGERPCFLCRSARPQEQMPYPWRDYEILVNPYPLGPGHLTIPSVSHEPQRLTRAKVRDMLALARFLNDECIFYNGPRCGASAPDHFHFQAIGSRVTRNLLFTSFFSTITSLSSADTIVSISTPAASPFGFFKLESDSGEALADKCLELMDMLPRTEHDVEPPVNLFAMANESSGRLRLFIIPRRCHRPSFYGEGDGQLLVSPASLEMAGLFVTPRADHAARLTADIVKRIYNEVAFSHEELSNLCNLK